VFAAIEAFLSRADVNQQRVLRAAKSKARFDKLSVPLRIGLLVSRSGHPEPVEGCFA
jgi:hypothetical protein